MGLDISSSQFYHQIMQLIATIKRHLGQTDLERQLKDSELKIHLVELKKKKLMLPITLYHL